MLNQSSKERLESYSNNQFSLEQSTKIQFSLTGSEKSKKKNRVQVFNSTKIQNLQRFNISGLNLEEQQNRNQENEQKLKFAQLVLENQIQPNFREVEQNDQQNEEFEFVI